MARVVTAATALARWRSMMVWRDVANAQFLIWMWTV